MPTPVVISATADFPLRVFSALRLSGGADSALLYVVGLGLGDEKDITVNGLEAVKKCERVYLEAYTYPYAQGAPGGLLGREVGGGSLSSRASTACSTRR